MANLLQDFANWSDGTVAPPALWNGTAYVFTAPATITYGGPGLDGERRGVLGRMFGWLRP